MFRFEKNIYYERILRNVTHITSIFIEIFFVADMVYIIHDMVFDQPGKGDRCTHFRVCAHIRRDEIKSAVCSDEPSFLW
jgi:hypothetical protein